MSTENEDKANSFCNSLQDGDLVKGVLYLSENIDYQNVGMSVSKGRIESLRRVMRCSETRTEGKCS